MIRRHFFLFAAVIVLAVMVVVGGVKVLSKKPDPAGGGAPAAAAQGGARPGGPGGPGGAAGRRGFGGPTLVSVAAVQPRAFEDTIEVIGIAKGRQSVTLTAATTQLVEKVRFADGQHVRAGAVLVELKNTEQDAGVAQAQAQLLEAKRAFDRYKTLGDQGWASKAQVDQYEAAWQTAQANVNAAKAREADRVIRAPFGGVVGLSDVAPGALVNPGAPIVTLDDVSVMRVDFQVPERYLAQLHQGQVILARADAFPGETLTGHIARLDTRVDERTRAITARAEFANTGGRLKPGMLLRIGISRGQRTSPSVPEAAISVQGDAAYAYVIHERSGRAFAEQRPIATGLRQQGFVEITEGLRPGDKVVADGLNKLQAGGGPVRIAPGGGSHGMGGMPGTAASPLSAGGAVPGGGQRRGPGAGPATAAPSGAAPGGGGAWPHRPRPDGAAAPSTSPAGARPMGQRPAA